MINMEKISDGIWEVPVGTKHGMRVPARILSSDKLIKGVEEGVIDQITNVSCLPGIQKYAICMPDAHRGYGFPIGGVAAFDSEEGVISPGGIGFDINCGMRLIRTDLTLGDVKPRLEQLLNGLFAAIPSGVGAGGSARPNKQDFRKVMIEGSKWCRDNGFASDEDVEHTESRGRVEGADPGAVSEKAISRGIPQLGSLGSGNHYLEIEFLAEGDLTNPAAAEIYGITGPGQIIIAVHCGSRGFGHQIATDYLRIFNQNAHKYNLAIKDRELAAAPIKSSDGEAYYAAMACAANYAFANRQVITHGIEKVFQKVFGLSPHHLGLSTIYDVAHNIARFEKYSVKGETKRLLVHRKGATRSFGPDNDDVPEIYRSIGQPVIVGGSMETGSALFAGTKEAEADYFGSTLHGSGRVMSRTKAKKQIRGDQLRDDMKQRGITVKTGHLRGLAEEGGFAYKDIDAVSHAVHDLGISRLVARFHPLANIKG
jgi:tRNA-splicing ligase RtcB